MVSKRRKIGTLFQSNLQNKAYQGNVKSNPPKRTHHCQSLRLASLNVPARNEENENSELVN